MLLSQRFLLILFLGLLTFKSVSSQAQAPNYINDPEYLSLFYTLKNGNLIVILSDRASIREKLVKHSDTERLNKFDAALQAEFQEYFKAFAKSYKFGSVYFMMRSELPLLERGDFSSMTFYSTQGTKVDAAQVNTQRFLLGEFGRMDRRSRGPLFAPKSARRTQPESSIAAFFLRTPNLEIIAKEYFMYQRTILRSKSGVVKRFNKRLARNERLIGIDEMEHLRRMRE